MIEETITAIAFITPRPENRARDITASTLQLPTHSQYENLLNISIFPSPSTTTARAIARVDRKENSSSSKEKGELTFG